MGSVFVAEQLSTGAHRALKIIRPELVGDARLRARFEQEARVTSRIASDHVVSVVAAGIDGPTQVPWLAMELLQGQTLADSLAARGPMSPGDFAELFTQLCHAVSAAHAVSVVHRDLKPENIFLAESRRTGTPFFAKVLDFGIARVMAEIKVSRTDALGTPLWMSPEQTSAGANIGPWTDIWPLGLIAFYALTGRMYWLAAANLESTMGVLREVVMDPLVPASARAAQLGVAERLPPGFDAWFAQCVEREPSRRFPSVAACRDALLPILQAVASQRSAQMTVLPQTAPTALGLGGASRASNPGVTPVPGVGGGTMAAGPNWTPYAQGGMPSGPQGTTGAPVAGTGGRSSVPTGGSSKTPIVVAVGLVAVLVLGGGATFAVHAYSQKKEATDCRDPKAPVDRRIEACASQCKANPMDDACRVRGELMVASDNDARAADGIEALRTTCNGGSAKACGALGSALAFPPRSSIKRDLKQAVSYLQKGCAADAKQCSDLGVGKELGWEGINDDALSYYQRACDAGDGIGCAYGAVQSGHGSDPSSIRRTGDFKAKAVTLLTPLCAAKNGAACAALGVVSDSESEAVQSFRAACDAGNALGCNNLGRANVEGKGGVTVSPKVAMDLFKKACEGGEVAGCNNLGALQANLPAVHRLGPRGADVYKFYCAGAFSAGCAAWGKPMSLWLGGNQNLSDAVSSFDKACDGGLLVACVNQGAMLLVGEGASRDRMHAHDLFTKACDGGDPGGCGESATLFLQDRVQQARDDRKGFALMQKACDGGELDACGNVYTLDIYGRGDAGKEADGWTKLQSLCSGSERTTCESVADLYLAGQGSVVPKDPPRARKLYEEACAAGVGRGCNSFGLILIQGLGGSKEEAKAVTIMRAACEQDDFDSCVNIGFLHMDGAAGVAKDAAKGNDYFEKGCKMGHAKSCNALSHSYVSGDGVKKDVGRAASLAHEACEGAYAAGCGTYGIMMAEGIAGPKDTGAAQPFLDVACRADIKEACDELKAQGFPLPAKP